MGGGRALKPRRRRRRARAGRNSEKSLTLTYLLCKGSVDITFENLRADLPARARAGRNSEQSVPYLIVLIKIRLGH